MEALKELEMPEIFPSKRSWETGISPSWLTEGKVTRLPVPQLYTLVQKPVVTRKLHHPKYIRDKMNQYPFIRGCGEGGIGEVGRWGGDRSSHRGPAV